MIALLIFGAALILSQIPTDDAEQIAEATPGATIDSSIITDTATLPPTATGGAGYPGSAEPDATAAPDDTAEVPPDETGSPELIDRTEVAEIDPDGSGYPGDDPEPIGPPSGDDELPETGTEPTIPGDEEPPPGAIATPQLIPTPAPPRPRPTTAPPTNGYPSQPQPSFPTPRPPRATTPPSDGSPGIEPSVEASPETGETIPPDIDTTASPEGSPAPDGTGTPDEPTSPTPTRSTATPAPPTAPPTPTARPAEILSGDVRWTTANSPYTIARDIAIPAGSSLTIDPGVEVRLGPNVQITVAGALRASGTAAAPIRLVGTGERWEALVGTAGSTLVIEQAQLRQAGRSGTAISSTEGALTIRNVDLQESTGGIVAVRSALDLQNTQVQGNNLSGPAVNVQLPRSGLVTIRGNRIGGNATPAGVGQINIGGAERSEPFTIEGNLIAANGNPGLILNTAAPLSGAIRCNTFAGGTVGLQLAAQVPDTSGFSLALDNNSFIGQTIYGATGTLAFNMTNNWWGDASGPFDGRSNAQGRGVPIGVNLLFQPWLTGRPTCAPAQ